MGDLGLFAKVDGTRCRRQVAGDGILLSRELPDFACHSAILATCYPERPRARGILGFISARDSSGNTIFDAGMEYGTMGTMETARKITVEVPLELLEKAQRASGASITQTVRTGLQLVAASRTYARLRQLRGKVRFTRTLAELKADR